MLTDISPLFWKATLVAQLSCLICSPFSCITWRILQKLAGKNVTANINLYDEDDEDCFITSANQVVVRTIEISNLHQGYSTASARKVRVEMLLTNCLEKELDPQRIAYIRTKMTRLAPDPSTLDTKKTSTIHRTQNSEECISDRGNNKRASGMRFEARNIEQWGEKVFENEVVVEVYRAAYGSKYQNKARNEANPDDAASIAELVFHFSEDGLRDKTPKDWALMSKLRSHKMKGLQGLRRIREGRGEKGEDNEDDHWWGRRSTWRVR